VGRTLVAEQKARSRDGRCRAGGERATDIVRPGDPPGEEHREVAGKRGPGPLEQLDRGQLAANVAPGLDALRDHRVRASPLRRHRLPDRAALVDPQARRPSRGTPPERHHGIGLARRPPVAGTGEREQQVDGDRLRGEPARGADLRPQRGRVEDPDRAEAAGLGDGCGELVRRRAATHPGLDDRQPDPDPLEQPAHEGKLAAPVVGGRETTARPRAGTRRRAAVAQSRAGGGGCESLASLAGPERSSLTAYAAWAMTAASRTPKQSMTGDIGLTSLVATGVAPVQG